MRCEPLRIPLITTLTFRSFLPPQSGFRDRCPLFRTIAFGDAREDGKWALHIFLLQTMHPYLRFLVRGVAIAHRGYSARLSGRGALATEGRLEGLFQGHHEGRLPESAAADELFRLRSLHSAIRSELFRGNE